MSKRPAVEVQDLPAASASTSGAAPRAPTNRRDYGPRAARPAAAQAVRLRRAARGQAAPARLLRQHHREAVPPLLTTSPATARATPARTWSGCWRRRLDAVVYRMKFVPTVFAARQFVNHGHILVNGRRVTIPSYLVKDEGPDHGARALEAAAAGCWRRSIRPSARCRDYLEVDHDRMEGRFIRAPKFADVPYPVTMEPQSRHRVLLAIERVRL